jgi:DtxR family Mn-dependent transcriptional regulator
MEVTIWSGLVGLMLAGAGVLLVWPRGGLWARWRRLRQAHRRARVEDVLKHLHACEWRGGLATPESLAGALRLSARAASRLIADMRAQGWLTTTDGLRLTPQGVQLALPVIRAHRLWERYLADEARMPLTAIHAEAERREHDHSAEALSALDAALGHPVSDPHGDPIPTAEGLVARAATQPLNDWPLNVPARIVHLEDEPAIIFNQIVAEGLRPGQVVRVIEAGARRVVLTDGERTHTLAPSVAANVFVAPDGAGEPLRPPRNLTALRVGQQATVDRLDDSLQGFTRRRLLDLGLTPGTIVAAQMRSLMGDPTAYRVRGALIALRREQAEKVLISTLE